MAATPAPPSTRRSTRSTPANVKELKVVWEWKAQNFGRRPDFNWEVTPLMVGGVLYFTAGTRRDAVAVDAATGETLWMYRLDEGARGDRRGAHRQPRAGVLERRQRRRPDPADLARLPVDRAECQERTSAPGFGKDGMIDLTEGLDRAVVKPGQIGSSSPAIVVRDTVVVGAALLTGTAPRIEEERAGLHSRLRRAHRQEAVDLQDHSPGRASSATRPGRTIPGSTPATPAHGRR